MKHELNDKLIEIIKVGLRENNRMCCSTHHERQAARLALDELATRIDYTPEEISTRIKNDVNGNPRRVSHYLHWLTDEDREEAKRRSEIIGSRIFAVEHAYQIALQRARKMGGRKFHNKQFGGGIVCQAYNDADVIERIERAKQIKLKY